MDRCDPEEPDDADRQLRRQFRWGTASERLAALKALYDRNVVAVVASLKTMVGRDDALQLTQDTFVQVLEQWEQYDDARRFEPWLFSIARHKAVDLLRRAGKEKLATVQMQRELSGAQYEVRYGEKSPLPARPVEALDGPVGPMVEYRLRLGATSGWTEVANVWELKDILEREGSRGKSLEFRVVPCLAPHQKDTGSLGHTLAQGERVTAGLNSLSPQERTAVLAGLFLAPWLKDQEIADILGWTLQNYKKHKSCGLTKLRRVLAITKDGSPAADGE
jgi:RNA polymerase sigma-70 factor (ECF subfamily)